MAETVSSRDPATRAALRASVLLMMVISVSAQASARGLGEVSHSARAALQIRMIAERVLPVQTEAGLATGIRFELPETASPTSTGITLPADALVRTPRCPVRVALLALPPPSA